jgi:hypothetical protein
VFAETVFSAATHLSLTGYEFCTHLLSQLLPVREEQVCECASVCACKWLICCGRSACGARVAIVACPSCPALGKLPSLLMFPAPCLYYRHPLRVCLCPCACARACTSSHMGKFVPNGVCARTSPCIWPSCVGRNFFMGTIPRALSLLTSLEYLGISVSRLASSSLPTGLSRLPALRTLLVPAAGLSGPFPSWLTAVTVRIVHACPLSAGVLRQVVVCCGVKWCACLCSLVVPVSAPGSSPTPPARTLFHVTAITTATAVSTTTVSSSTTTPAGAAPHRMQPSPFPCNRLRHPFHVPPPPLIPQAHLRVRTTPPSPLRPCLGHNRRPAFVCAPQTLRLLDLQSNALTGTLPPGLTALTALTALRLNSNFISGPPVLPPRVVDLDLGTNRLSGPLPLTWPTTLTAVRQLPFSALYR